MEFLWEIMGLECKLVCPTLSRRRSSSILNFSPIRKRKLTEDLRIHRKNHVLDRFEETTRVMDSRMQQMDGVLGRHEEVCTLMLDRIEASAEMMDEKIESMRQIGNVTQLLRDQIDTVDERIESMISNTIANSMVSK